ncbi:MAG: hypothetical protein LBK76_03200 [Verrucomicrobiales bacterium]|jgi:hypothetical protein|nr:hypothetical protein [Verrucomicrobiales bacterium]
MHPGELSFDELVPRARAGLGVLYNTYGGGRVGAQVNHFGGFGRIVYWGDQPYWSGHNSQSADAEPQVYFQTLGQGAYTRCFRPQLLIDGLPYNLEFTDTRQFPFGYASRFTVSASRVLVEHRLTVVNDALLFTVSVLKNPRRCRLQQRFEHHDQTQIVHPARTWSGWERAAALGGWRQRVRDRLTAAEWARLRRETRQVPKVGYPLLDNGRREFTAHLALCGDLPLTMQTTQSGRRYFIGGAFTGGTHVGALVFAPDARTLTRRAQELTADRDLAAAKERAHRQRLATAPGVELRDKVFSSAFANVPPTLESLMVADLPGGMRASSMHYWIWGWDTLMCSDAYLLGGRADFVRDLLRFYRATADPRYGVGHMFSRAAGRRPRARIPMAPSAQLLWLIVLYQYAVHTGDRRPWREHYAFAKKIFAQNLRDVNERGLGAGPALFPDFPALCGHTGRDLSVFNNSLLYQGARCMAALAADGGDTATVSAAARLARRLEENFDAAFWDARRGYFVDSVDADSGAQRKSYPAHALLWQTPLLHDLAGARLAACGEFQARHLATPRGFLIYPRWDAAFDGDGNQLAQIWSTSDVFDTRCQAAAGHDGVLEDWLKSGGWFWRQQTYIEGYSAQTVNDSGTPDAPGGKQPFGAKSLYLALFTGVAGVHFDLGGLEFAEGLRRLVKIDRLNFQGRRYTLTLRGRGAFIRSLTVNGRAVRGTRKLPQAALRRRNTVSVVRTTRPPSHPLLLGCHGATLENVAVRGQKLSLTVSGDTAVWLRYYSPRPPALTVNGAPAATGYDRATGNGKILLSLAAGRPAKIALAI